MIKEELINFLGTENVFENEPMKKHISFKTGGNADFFVLINSIEKLRKILKFIKDNDLDYFIIGNGTNLLVTDKGFRGIIIKLKFDEIEIEKKEKFAILKIGAGVPLGSLRKTILDNNLDNMEFLVGIPGTIGGAVKMNAGAYGGEIKELVVETEVMDEEGNIFTLSNNEQEFKYRESIFMQKKLIILNTKLKTNYKKKELIEEKIEELSQKRKQSQPLEWPSAGSTFKRKDNIITAKLIDECGLKGFSIGGAKVSEKHAGFIINTGEATSKNILDLVEFIKEKVLERFNEKIELEILVIGEK